MNFTTFDKSQAMALKLGDAAQVLFCTFDVSKKDGRLIKKPIRRDGKAGVPAVISDEALFTASDVYGMEAIQHGQYFGLNMNKPNFVEGKGYLVCLDVDMKHKPNSDKTHQAILRLRSWVVEKNVLTEKSLSGVGRHVFVFAKTANNILRNYPLAEGQEVEIFGLESSDKKSILLTGEAMKGEVVEIDDLETLLIDLGIAKQKIAPEPVSPKQSENQDFLSLAPALAPKANHEGFNPPLQASARQYVSNPHETYLKAVNALQYLSADMQEPDWWRIGVALQNDLGEHGRELFINWSSTSVKYKGYAETSRKYDRAISDKGLTIATVLWQAQRHPGFKALTFSRQSAQADFSGLTIDKETGEVLPPALTPVSINDVISNPSPAPAFVWDGYLPKGEVSLLAAHGAAGKSTIGLMLCVAAALGRPLFGVDTVQCNTLFVSLEDSAPVVRYRLAGICRIWFIDPSELGDKLTVVDGAEYPELFSADNRQGGDTTRTYFEMKQLVKTYEVGLAVIDNASDAFGGDEIQRRQVRAFIRSLSQILKPGNAALLLLAHVDKNTSRSKQSENSEGYTGSTAWHNSVRSRLFMKREDNGNLNIDHQKLNLGCKREKLTLTWQKGEMMPRLADGASYADLDPQAARLAAKADDELCIKLLRMIHEFASREQYCGTSTMARDHAFAILKSEPVFKVLGLKREDTQRLLNQCQRAKWLERFDYKSADYKPKNRWELTQAGQLFAGLSAQLPVIVKSVGALQEEKPNEEEFTPSAVRPLIS